MYFYINYELKEDNGEDAPPVFNDKMLAVFDGMGGAGGAKYNVDEFGEKSGAYIASRVASRFVTDFITGNYDEFFKYMDTQENKTAVCEKYAVSLKDYVQKNMENYAELNGIRENTRVRSIMFKLLPTTMACIIYRENTDSLEAVCLWAGDSRCFVLAPRDGLMQISKDDLKLDNDAMQNLLEDSQISNCINLSTDYIINSKYLKIPKPAILFCASDGCFGYFPSPMHFEYALLDSLESDMDADNNDFGNRVSKNISSITADDCTMAGKCFGFKSMSNLFKSFFFQKANLKKDYIDCSPAGNNEISVFSKRIEQEEKTRLLIIENISDIYKDRIIDMIGMELLSDKTYIKPVPYILRDFEEFKKSSPVVMYKVQKCQELKTLNQAIDKLKKDLYSNLCDDYIGSLIKKGEFKKGLVRHTIEERLAFLTDKRREIIEQAISKATNNRNRFGSLVDLVDGILSKAEKGIVDDVPMERLDSLYDEFGEICSFLNYCLASQGKGFYSEVQSIDREIKTIRKEMIARAGGSINNVYNSIIQNVSGIGSIQKLFGFGYKTNETINSLKSSSDEVKILQSEFRKTDGLKECTAYFELHKNEIINNLCMLDDKECGIPDQIAGNYRASVAKIAVIHREIDELKSRGKGDMKELWNKYKVTYERYLYA